MKFFTILSAISLLASPAFSVPTPYWDLSNDATTASPVLRDDFRVIPLNDTQMLNAVIVLTPEMNHRLGGPNSFKVENVTKALQNFAETTVGSYILDFDMAEYQCVEKVTWAERLMTRCYKLSGKKHCQADLQYLPANKTGSIAHFGCIDVIESNTPVIPEKFLKIDAGSEYMLDALNYFVPEINRRLGGPNTYNLDYVISALTDANNREDQHYKLQFEMHQFHCTWQHILGTRSGPFERCTQLSVKKRCDAELYYLTANKTGHIMHFDCIDVTEDFKPIATDDKNMTEALKFNMPYIQVKLGYEVANTNELEKITAALENFGDHAEGHYKVQFEISRKKCTMTFNWTDQYPKVTCTPILERKQCDMEMLYVKSDPNSGRMVRLECQALPLTN